MRRNPICRALSVAASFFMAPAVLAQEVPSDTTSTTREGAPNVFIDCNECDMNYIRQEVTSINYVRDQAQSDVFVFATNQQTGSGGETFTFTFIGQGRFEGIGHVLTYTSGATDTDDDERSGVTETIKVGLVPYLIRTPQAAGISVDFGDGDGDESLIVADDPWDSWVFEIEAGGSLDKEQSANEYELEASANARRVTEAWKIDQEFSGSYQEENFTRENDGEERTITSVRRDLEYEGSVVKSLTEHWSAGVFAEVYSNTFQNFDLGIDFSPALEFNIFPYRESARREWVVRYQLIGSHQDYADTTLFGKTEEFLLKESLTTSLRFQQPWGFIDASLSGSHYFHDFTKNAIEFDSFLSIRITEGLSVRFGGSFELINDQLYLEGGDLTLEELLLRQRELATDYQLSTSLSLSYTFGSAYSNVVNTRLRQQGGGGDDFD